MEPESDEYILSQTPATTMQNTGWMMQITAGMPQLILQMPGRQNGGLIGNLHFLLVAEGNAVNSWRNLAVHLLENNIDEELIHRSPTRAKNTRARASISSGEGIHAIMNHPYFTRKVAWKHSETAKKGS